jgi:antitoxin (DNA-binding transcriptional repressor) of toxin-antitoxin stability system
MDTVTLTEAKEHLEDLAVRAAGGEDVRFDVPGTGRFRLVPVIEGAIRKPRRLGHLEGKIAPPPDDFFDPLSEEELKLWHGDGA